jgi:UDP-2,3-diacylglucosamine pyrophosphatase LpxH
MDPFRIVHISDLHFGMDYQHDVWQSLVDHLLREPRPDAIIATGDLVDTPDPRLFDQAAAQFKRFTEAGIRWTVCAGNHDRHSRGNAGWLGRIMGWLKDSNMDPASFDRKFKGHIADLQEPQEWTFPDVASGAETPVPKWRVRIVGIDSSKAAQYSAQGFVKPNILGGVNAATRSSQNEETTRDLIIALVHHHLLPIAALEQSAQHASSMLNTTTLVNAGSVLENCATNNINLVLHGHEHMRNIARYGVPGEPLASDMVVLGAGSATGADTWAGCDVTRASINVLELRRDRSVHVREQRIVHGQWQDSDAAAVRLLDGRQIREARILRREDVKARPVSRIERHFAFTEYRDIDVRETRTFWPVSKDHQFVFDVHRLSGSPILGKLNVDWEGGGADRWAGNPVANEKAANFDRAPDGHRGYRLQVRADDSRIRAQRLELEYTWSRSAVLTMTDLQLLRADQRDEFREADKEAVSIHVVDPLDSLTLSISLPPALLPEGRIEVHVGHLENGQEKIEPHQELQEFLHVMPGGFATLTVPFPLPECRYFLAWKPHAKFLPDASVTATRERIGARGDAIAAGVVADLMPRISRRCSVALYEPRLVDPAGVEFRLRGFAAGGDAAAGANRPDEIYRARDEYDSILGAWYGEPSWTSVDPANPDDRDGMREGEDDVFVLPAYQFRWSPASEPWGIIRIGLGAGEPIDEELAERIAMAAAIVL